MEKIESNNAFSIDRFKTLMKADLSTNKSNYIKLAIGTVGVFMAIALLNSILTVISINSLKHVSEMTGNLMESAIQTRQNTGGMTYFTISIWVFCVFMTVIGSLTFSNLSSKRSRISSFMIPASRTEKFLLRFLTYLVGGTILLGIGFLLGMLVCQIAFGGGGAVWGELSAFFSQEYSGSLTLALVMMALLGNSIYALGSSLWPKLSWIKTWVVVMVIQWVGALIMMMVATADIQWYSFITFCGDNIGFFKWAGLTTLALLNIACWILAWYRYKSTQIIQRFMTK